jgi:tetratricopeptide (TPR) repeat protein
LVVAAAFLVGRRALSVIPVPPARVIAAIAVVVMVAGYFTVETRARNRMYESEASIWLDAVQAEPQNARARVSYAIVLLRAARYDEARAQLQVAVDIDDRDPLAQENLGAALLGLGRFADAIPHFERALSVSPADVTAHRNAGLAYAAVGQDAPAALHLERALAAEPDDPAALTALARIRGSSDVATLVDRPRAVALAERAVRVTVAQDVNALNTLAAALAATGDMVKAAMTERGAAEVARAQGQTALARDLDQRAAQYQSKIKMP